MEGGDAFRFQFTLAMLLPLFCNPRSQRIALLSVIEWHEAMSLSCGEGF